MTIGDLWMRVVADDRGFEADLVKKTGKAADTAGQGMAARIKKAFSGGELGKGLVAGLGLAGGVGVFNLVSGGIQKVTDFLGDSRKAAEENEVAYTKLAASLKANVPAWDGNLDAIKKVNEAGAALGFTDNEMADALARLVGATHDVIAAENARSIAMDLARFKGISLAEATDALTKVEGGRFRLLAGLGIILEKGATITEAVAAVQKVAGGQAEAYSKTTAGAMARLSASFEQVQEKIGAQLLPVMSTLANAIVDDVIPAGEDFVGTLGDILSPAAKLNDLLQDQGGIVGILGDAWEAATAPLRNAGDALFEIGYQMDTVSGKAHTAEDDLRHAALSIGVSVDELKTAFEQSMGAVQAWSHEGEGAAHAMSQAFVDAKPAIVAAAGDDARVLQNEIAGQAENVRREAYESALAAASGLIAGQGDVESGAAALVEAMKHPISGAKRIALLEGQLSGDELARGLASKDPIVRAKALGWKNAIEAQLDALRKAAATSGGNIGTGWIGGIASGIAYHYYLLTHELNRVAGDMKGKSPPKTGPLKDIDKGAAAIARSWNTAFAGELANAQGLSRRALGGISLSVGGGYRSEMFVPSSYGPTLPGVPSMAASGSSGGAPGGGTSITIHNPEPHAAEEDIGRLMRRLEALGMAR